MTVLSNGVESPPENSASLSSPLSIPEAEFRDLAGSLVAKTQFNPGQRI